MTTSLVRILLAFGVAGLIGAGCTDRLYDTGETINLVDGGPARVDTGRDLISSGDAGLGGATGTGGAAGSGAGGMTGVGGDLNACDDSSPLRQTDLANCGHCFNQCYQMNADATCTAGACQYTCFNGFFDADHDPANGCECEPTNGGVELCDGVDNDCNGTVDDGFDLMSDLTNCGGCNRPCYVPFAATSCDMGVCNQGACLPNFYDVDPAVAGCETYCMKTNGGVEVCDGLDNDCNGLVDDNVRPATITCRSQGTICAGIVPVCMGAQGYVCPYRAGYQDLEDTTLNCDGLDNDCDGQIDEPFLINKPCSTGLSGVCAAGKWACDNTATGKHKCVSVTPSSNEICDGLDNDCDGTVDELSKLSDTHGESLVVITPPSGATYPPAFTMFAYEASHADSGKDSMSNDIVGIDTTHRPCSIPGRLPWNNVKKESAEAACEKIGDGLWRLCSAAEWRFACNRTFAVIVDGGMVGTDGGGVDGGAANAFPYGPTYGTTTCNGYDKGAGATVTGGTVTGCITDFGTAGKVYDLSGNVKEWAATTLQATKPYAATYEMRGGAYNTASFVVGGATTAPGLQCDSSVPAPVSDVILPSVGFRCCHPGALPN